MATAAGGPVRVGDVVLGRGRPAIIVPLTAPDPERLRREALDLRGHPADLVEWRIDRFAPGDDDAGHRRAVRSALPVLRDALEGVGDRGRTPGLLVTLRTAAEGGGRAVDADALRATLEAVLDGDGVDLLDVEEAAIGPHRTALLAGARAAGVRTVVSRHELERTPPVAELEATLERLRDSGADVVKLAVMPRTPQDVLAMLRATARMRAAHPGTPLITMSMGPLGAVTRLAGQEFGSVASFGTVGAASAPGQLPADDLAQVLDLVAERAAAGR